jgi:hypothetical protein
MQYTQEHLQVTIEARRELARERAKRTAGDVGQYERVVHAPESGAQWAVQTVLIHSSGEETPMPLRYCTLYTTEQEALSRALRTNVDRLDEVFHREHFTRDRRNMGGLGPRKKAHPFEASPTLARALRQGGGTEH